MIRHGNGSGSLENGDEEAHELWQWFRDASLQEFNDVYEKLGVTFDTFNGEAFYNDKLEEVGPDS